ncbi:serine/threonine kinase family protein [Plesiocystis pacifica SIR-1]|uniref:Serine/threonine kinase family protein n=1 Tax=Plesiocystis pacifica SIR-1 TaxID=391625 RepID=A6G3R5_9BACT|nr:serine/threonine kinase family protein [Plesiocystis pacifica SIR-1]
MTGDMDVSREIESARDDEEGREAAARRKRLAAAMFGVVEDEPERLGRFELVRHLGSGGVGSVHIARDPQLDRQVAIKLLRGQQNLSTQARERLLREAQMLARLSHPNVVPVYEAGILEGEVYIAMEFIPGRDLSRWLRASEPTWRELVEVYLQAGQGLAAAHALGIVHRDFKPANAILGEDGRVRVLDFGLARPALYEDGEGPEPTAADANADANVEVGGELGNPNWRESFELDATQSEVELAGPDSPTQSRQGSSRRSASASVRPRAESRSGAQSNSGASPSGSLPRLTRTGAIMGTPAYMAPEQFLGADVGPAADQFAFCLALYEGLYGRRAFPGDDFDAIRKATLMGERREPPRNTEVPRWLWPILRRGLERRPEDRFPSMDALLVELGRDRQRMRRRVFAGTLAVAMSLGSAAAAWQLRGDSTVEQCSGAPEQLAKVWSASRREAVSDALLGTGRDYAGEAAARSLGALDGYAADWVAMRTAACETHLRGEQSDALFDRRTACLDRAKLALDATADALAGLDAARLPRAVELVEALPELDACADVEALELAALAPPADPEQAAEADELRAELLRLSTLLTAGRDGEALDGFGPLELRARSLAYAPVQVEVLLAHGRALLHANRFPEAGERLREASLLGFEIGMDAPALEALARLVFVESRLTPERIEASLAYLPFAEALTRRVPRTDFERALLLNNRGTAQLAAGDRAGARASFVEALELVDAAELDQPELAFVAQNLSTVEDDPLRREALSAQAVAKLEASLGPNHPHALRARYVRTHGLSDAREAATLRAEVCERLATQHPEERMLTVECNYTLGNLWMLLGEDAAAIAAHREVVAQAGDQVELSAVRAVAEGYVALSSGNDAAAQAAFGLVVVEEDSPEAAELPWWKSREHAWAWFGLARTFDGPDHRRALERALEHFDRVLEHSANGDLSRARARAAEALEAAPQPE